MDTDARVHEARSTKGNGRLAKERAQSSRVDSGGIRGAKATNRTGGQGKKHLTKTLVEEYVDDPNHMRLFQQERSIYEVTELLESLMHELHVNRAELANRLGKSKGWVTQLLDGESNKTIRTVADAFAVLGYEFRAFCQPIQIATKPSERGS